LDPYEVLGIEPDATDSEIKKAYRRLARQWHPDVNSASGAEDEFKRIQLAYDLAMGKTHAKPAQASSNPFGEPFVGTPMEDYLSYFGVKFTAGGVPLDEWMRQQGFDDIRSRFAEAFRPETARERWIRRLREWRDRIWLERYLARSERRAKRLLAVHEGVQRSIMRRHQRAQRRQQRRVNRYLRRSGRTIRI
jgi:hypothetical protein